LRNLLSNAIKYTQEGSVELRCEPKGTRVRLEVRDTGVGIAADQLTLIFDEFYQVGISPQSARDGYGLGLSIVKRIARLLGTRVEVSSQPGQGSVFAIELPAASPTAGVTAARSAPKPHADAAPACHVLLVEDEPGVRNAMRTLLKVEGYEVTTAESAEEAFKKLAGEGFDLLVTDYHLESGHTGTQVIAAARERLGADFRAILVTGDTSAAIRELHGDEHLRIASKPINSEQLLEQVRSLLSG
jgi:CheY-like chemotaxis protein